MGNTYNVVEEGSITCACGGKVTLASSVQKYTLGGKKPLYWKDLLGASVACPRSPKQNPCTSVAAISPAGTETNVGAKGEPYLLRTDGFVTDKGRGVILVAPGQTQSQIKAVPSVENKEIEEEPAVEVEEKKVIEKKSKEKYGLYFLRKSETLYKPLRPSRKFRKEGHTVFSNKQYTTLDSTSVHARSMAFLYLIQNGDVSEYKIFSDGNIYNEKLKEVTFQKTTDEAEKPRHDIPLLEDSSVDIYYSNIHLSKKSDIVKLKKVTINPKVPNNVDNFYVKDEDSIDKRELTADDIATQKKFVPNKEGKTKRRNIVVVIDDILGEIEDMYEQYHKSYVNTYIQNNTIIEDIKSKNAYTYTIANYLEHFHVSKTEQDEYDANIKTLSDNYKELVKLVVTTPSLGLLVLEDNNVANVIEKADKIALSYFNETIYIKKDFFKSIVVPKSNSNYFSLNGAVFANKKYKSYYESSRSQSRGYIKDTNNYLNFISTNTEISKLKNEPSNVMALIVFSLFFSLKYEDKLQKTGSFSKIDKLRKQFYFTLKNTKAMPQISEDNIRDIKKLMSKQTTYLDIFSRKDKLISEYDNLEHDKKINSFKNDGKPISYKSLYFTKGDKFFKGVQEPAQSVMQKIYAKLQDSRLSTLLSKYSKFDVEEKEYVLSAMNFIYMLHYSRTKLDEESNLNTCFNQEHSKLLEFVSDLTKRRKELSNEDKEYIEENYSIHKEYNQMQIELIGHAFLAQNQKRKGIVEKFLKQFPVEKQKYELVLPNLLDNNYDEEFKAKGKVEDLYETLKAIDGYSSKVGDVVDEFKKTRDSDQLKKYTKQLNSSIKGLSFLIAGANTVSYLSGKEKITIPSVVSMVNDMTMLTNATSKAFLDKQVSSSPIKFAEKVITSDKLDRISKSSEKLMSRIGIPLIILNDLFESNKLIKNEDYDGLIVTNIKNLLVITLLLSPSIIGFISIAIIELAWYLLSHYVLDSDVEVYIKKSILFKNQNKRPFITYKGKAIFSDDKSQKNYLTRILIETTSSNDKLKNISSDGFNNVKSIKSFIGDNYEENQDIFNAALQNEIYKMKSALFGYKLDLLKKVTRDKKALNKYNVNVNLICTSTIEISNELYKDKKFKLISVDDKNNYTDLNMNNIVKDDDKYNFNLLHQNVNSLVDLKKFNGKKYSIIAVSSNVIMKYEYTYQYLPIEYVRILNYEEVLLNEIDIKYITEGNK